MTDIIQWDKSKPVRQYGLVGAKLEPLAYGFNEFSHSETQMLVIAERESFSTGSVVMLVANDDPLPIAVFIKGILYVPQFKSGPDKD